MASSTLVHPVELASTRLRLAVAVAVVVVVVVVKRNLRQLELALGLSRHSKLPSGDHSLCRRRLDSTPPRR